MRRYTELIAVALLAAVAVTAVQVLTAQDSLITSNAYIDEWDGIRVIGKSDGTCPEGWSADEDFEGRYVVGTPDGGTNNATSGTVLSDQEIRRGGTAASGSFSAPSISGGSYSLSGTAPSISGGSYSASGGSHAHEINFSHTHTGNAPAHTHSGNHTHTHGYSRLSIRTGNLRGGGSGSTVGSSTGTTNNPSLSSFTTAGASASGFTTAGPSPSFKTTASSTSGVSLTGSAPSISGGSYSLSGSAPSISGGGGSWSIADQLQPAPYIQVTICEYDPV